MCTSAFPTLDRKISGIYCVFNYCITFLRILLQFQIVLKAWLRDGLTVPMATLQVAAFNGLCWGTGGVWCLDAVLSEFNRTGFISFSSVGALGIWKSGMFQGLNCLYMQNPRIKLLVYCSEKRRNSISVFIFRQFRALVHATLSCTLWILQAKLQQWDSR